MVPREFVDIVVVGAGMAGLVAATTLRMTRPDLSVVVVDKGRGVGGRMATRRVGAATFDHGAPCFRAAGPPLADLVGDGELVDVVAPWPALRTRSVRRGRTNSSVLDEQNGQWRGAPTMTAIAKHLATGQDVRTGWRVDEVRTNGDGWIVRSTDAELRTRLLVLTCPVPQSLALLDSGAVRLPNRTRAALAVISYDPCLVVLAADTGIEDPTVSDWSDPDADVVIRIVDQHATGTSSAPAWVIQASPAYSLEHWSSLDDRVIEDLCTSAREIAGTPPVFPSTQVHRWRYARATRGRPEAVVVVDGPPPLLFAGDGFGPGDVDGAAASGHAAAGAAADLLRRIPSTG